MKNKLILIVFPAVLLAGAAVGAVGYRSWARAQIKAINSFEKCQAAGYPVAESYPEQCFTPDGRGFTKKIPDEGVACTMEAKICPDGSAVGRIGPNCEFEACP